MRELGANCVRTFTRAAALAARSRRRARPLGAGRGSRGRSTSASSTRKRRSWRIARHGPSGGREARAATRRSSATSSATRSRPTSSAGTVPSGSRASCAALRRGEVRETRSDRAGQLRELPVDRVSRSRVRRLPLLQRLPAREHDFRRYLARLQNLADRQAARADRVRHRLDPRGRRRRRRRCSSWQIRAAFEGGRRRHVRLLLDRRVVHRRRRQIDGLGVRPGRRASAEAEAGVPRGAAAVRRAAAAALRESAEGLGRDLRLQRRAHDGGVPRVADEAPLPRLRGHRRQRRLDGRARAEHRAHARRSPALRADQPGEQGPVGRAQRRHGGRDRRDRRLHRLRLRRRPGLAHLPGLHDGPARLRRRAAGRTSRRPRRSLVPACVAVVAGRADARARSTTRSPSTSPAATWRSGRTRSRRSAASSRIFAAAGDDVDLCWRLQNRGYAIGFSPARHGLALPAQHGEGVPQASSAATARRRRCSTSSIRTASTCSASRAGSAASTASSPSTFFSRRPVIYYGTFGRGLFQTLYEPPSSLLLVPAVHARVERGGGDAALLRRSPRAATWRSRRCRSLVSFGGIDRPRAAARRIDPRYDGVRTRAARAADLSGTALGVPTSATGGGSAGSATSSRSSFDRAPAEAARAGSAREFRVALLERDGARRRRICSRGSSSFSCRASTSSTSTAAGTTGTSRSTAASGRTRG